MPDNLAIIRRVIQEHRLITGNIEKVGDSINDLEATFNLQKLYSLWAQSSIEVLDEKQKKLQQSMRFLDAGLRRHFHFEEEALPPLFGQILMDALLLEHRNIIGKLDEMKTLLTDSLLEGLAQEEVLARKSHIQQMVSAICQMNAEHLNREEAILTMIQKSLEAKQPDRS